MWLLGGGCTVESEPLFEPVEPLDVTVSRPGNLPAFPAGGSGGRGQSGANGDGVLGEGIVGLLGVDAGAADGGSASDAGSDSGPICTLAAECDDGNECTVDECSAGSCRNSVQPEGSACGGEQSECLQPGRCDGAGRCVVEPAPAGTACGRAASNECSADSCDGAGSCQVVDVPAGTACGDDGDGCSTSSCDGAGSCEAQPQPDGSACPGGSCTLGACIEGQPVGCPALLASEAPFEAAWSSAGRPDLIRGSCDDSVNTPDFALVFTAPAAGVYRIDAQGSPDVVLAVRAGACLGAELACNDDVTPNNRNSRLDLTLSAGQTITLYLSEFGNGASGAGSVQITLP